MIFEPDFDGRRGSGLCGFLEEDVLSKESLRY